MSTKQTCTDRIADHYQNMLSEVREILDSEDPIQAINEYALGFDYVPHHTFQDQWCGYFRLQISWGGPSSEVRFYTDASNYMHTAEYWFLDWFDGASETMDRDLAADLFSLLTCDDPSLIADMIDRAEC